MTAFELATATSAILARIYPLPLERALKLVEDLSDEEFYRLQNATTNSMAWNLWHLARFADRAQSNLRLWSPALRERLGSGGEFWDEEEMAATWGLDTNSLGWNETGMEMEPDVAHHLKLPARETLLEYARRSFTAASKEVELLDDNDLRLEYISAIDGAPSTVESALVVWVTHNERHLGMLECLRGLLGRTGSATR
jgi:DinB superfamily